MGRKITLLDGAQGTRLWALAEENGFAKTPVWKYNIEHPEIVAQVCREYAQAGTEIVCANTFSANRIEVERSSSYTVEQVITAAVRTAKEALAGTGVKIALDIGPLTVMMEPYGDLEEEEAAEIFDEMIKCGVDAEADCIFFETFLDLNMMRAATEAAVKYGLPVFCSMTFEKSGRTMMGNKVPDIVEELEELGIAGIGMNCSLGPDQALPIIREFAENTKLPLFFKPNAGLPVKTADGEDFSVCSPESFTENVAEVLDLISYVGGCCGTDAGYIRRLRELIDRQSV